LKDLFPVQNLPEEDTIKDTWPVLESAALYGLAGDIVRTIEPQSEADRAALLLQTLAAAGNLLGSEVFCTVGSTLHGLRLFVVLVGESSKARKGTSWNPIKRLFALVDPTWGSERITTGLSSGEGLIAEVRDDGEVVLDRRLLIVQSEFASVLKIMAREGNTLSAILRDAWDEGNLRTLVKREPLKATGAHISVIGHITRQELMRYLSDTEAHNGFANRLLWSSVKRSKYLPEGGDLPDATFLGLAKRLQAVLTWARARQGRQLQRDENAKALWANVYPQLSDGLPGLLGAATSRAEAQVLRLSAIYAALDCSDQIRVEHLQAALAVWDFVFESARHIFGDATGDPVADRIRKELENAGEAGLTRTDISQKLGRHIPAERIGQALAQLAAIGVAERLTVRTEGRSTELWLAK
jgi:hypothetical protein